MTTTTTEHANDERSLARERLKKRRDFNAHLFVYIVINAVIWGLWALTGDGGYPWPAWLSGLWAIGLVLNAWDVYVRRPITEEDVEREVRRLHDAH